MDRYETNSEREGSNYHFFGVHDVYLSIYV
jgi:hypothetical protein